MLSLLWSAPHVYAHGKAEWQQQILEDVHATRIGGNPTTEEGRDSVRQLISAFYEEQFRQFHDPEAPTFMFLTRDSRLAMGIGGKVMLRGWYDWHGSQPGPGFYPFNIKIPSDPTENRYLGSSINNTSVIATILGRRNSLRFRLYVQATFFSPHIEIQRAYVQLNDFTLGLATSTFEDIGAAPPTIDSQGPNGRITKDQVLARYIHTFKNGWSIGGGIEIPSARINAIDNETKACREHTPDIAALLQYSWDHGSSYVRLSGLFRSMTYRNLLTNKNHNVTGWGAQLSGTAATTPSLILYYSGVVGQGIGSYETDFLSQNYDLVGERDKPGELTAPLMMGLTAGVQYWFSPKVFASLSAGKLQYYQKNPLHDSEYRYGLYGAANLFWKYTPRLLSGIEYIVGKRKNFNGAQRNANRLSLMVSYSF